MLQHSPLEDESERCVNDTDLQIYFVLQFERCLTSWQVVGRAASKYNQRHGPARVQLVISILPVKWPLRCYPYL